MESWMIFIKFLVTAETLAAAINRPTWVAVERLVQMMNAYRPDFDMSDVYGFHKEKQVWFLEYSDGTQKPILRPVTPEEFMER